MKKYSFILFLLLLTPMVGAQVTISGTITDAQDGSTLPGVNILEMGTTSGTSSDHDGSYTLTVSDGATVVFSFVGYLSQEHPSGNGGTIDVSLALDILGLEEVVVIGYGTTKKADATGSVAAISTKDFNRGAITSPQELISGKIAGVHITNSGGAPGSGSTIRIRGGSSLSASNDPLIVIDGVPVDNESISGMSNPLSSVNPTDIETFTVLKDASATAIYGSRASNGVIIITTKKGKANQPLTVGYDGKVSVGIRAGEVDVLTTDEFKDMINDKYADNVNATVLLGTEDTDWQSEIYQTAIGHDHVLSLSGGFKLVPYRFSVGYSDLNGLLKTSNMKRMTGSLNMNPTFLNNHLKVNLNLKGMSTKNRFADRGAVGAAASFDPTKPVMDASSPYGGYYTWVQINGDPNTLATANPLARLELREDISDVYRILGNVQVDYNFHFLPELTAKLNVGYDNSSSEGTISVPDNASWEYDELLGGGEDRLYTQNKKNELIDMYFNYNTELTSVDSRIDATAGYSWQHFWREGTTYSTNVAETIVNADTDYETENYLVSFFGRLNYIFKEKYLLTATLRQDGSSRFSPENRWGLFPSVALAWNIADEQFIPDALSVFKLRLGWGVTGQQNISNNDYPYLPRYTLSEETARYMFGNSFVYTFRPEGYDANIKWEETTTYNIGLDYGIFDNRVNGSVDAYYRYTDDLINFIPVPAGTNLSNYLLTNVGDLINQGVEFSVNATVISKVDLAWEIGFNATYNQNEIKKLTAIDDPDYPGVPTGGISGGVGNNIQIHSVGWPARTFYVFEQVYDANGDPIENLYVDQNGDGSVTAEDDSYRFENPAPDVFMGFSSYLRYKDFDLNLNGRINIGNYVYNNQYSSAGTWGEMYHSTLYLRNVSRSVLDTDFETPRYFSDFYLENGSFLRLDNVTVGYNMSDLFGVVSNLRLFASVQNAFLYTKYNGLDPEVENGIDNNIFPRPKTFVLGVSAQF